jgi:hypothetical protein
MVHKREKKKLRLTSRIQAKIDKQERQALLGASAAGFVNLT